MPLTLAPQNTELKVIKVLAEEKTKKHLENLGILAGEKINVIAGQNGSVIVMVKQGRLALNKELATKILVA